MESEQIEKIKQDFPSICYSCDKARRPASEENLKKGYVGCCLRAMTKSGRSILEDDRTYDHFEIQEAKEVAEGWVDLRSKVFGGSSGIISNFQLLTSGVKECRQYKNSGL